MLNLLVKCWTKMRFWTKKRTIFSLITFFLLEVRVVLQALSQAPQPSIKSLDRHILVVERSLSRIYVIANIFGRQDKAASKILQMPNHPVGHISSSLKLSDRSLFRI